MRSIKAIVLATLIYLGVMAYAWVTGKVMLPFWQAIGFTAFFALIIYLLDSGDKKKREAVELELGAKQEEVEKRRLDAENYILNSGDEVAVNFLKRARANQHSYIRILSEGKDKGNNTLLTALGILSGMFEDTVPASAVDANGVAKALDSMASELVETTFKER
jgi:hypothetical protein